MWLYVDRPTHPPLSLSLSPSPQSFRQEISDRGMPELWYASVQWCHYLLFLPLLLLSTHYPLPSFNKKQGAHQLWVLHALVALGLCRTGQWLATGPYVAHKSHPFLFAPYLLLGVLSAYTLSNLQQRDSQWGRGWGHVAMDTLAIVMGLLIVLPLGPFDGPPVDCLDVSLGWTVLPLMANAIILLLVHGCRRGGGKGGMMGTVLGWEGMQLVGRLTLPLYLLHQVRGNYM